MTEKLVIYIVLLVLTIAFTLIFQHWQTRERPVAGKSNCATSDVVGLAQQKPLGIENEQTISLLEQNTIIAYPRSPEFPMNTVTLRRNGAFSGRDETLLKLHDRLQQDRSNNEPGFCVLHGIGGVGKTQTALEFSYRYRSDYECIFWIHAEREIDIHQSFGAAGRKLCLFTSDSVDRSKIERVQEWLYKTDKKWLAVFDNVRSWQSVSAYLPTECKANSSVLITSQKAYDWVGHKIQLDPLSTEVGSDLLLKQLDIKRSEPTDYLAREVVAIIGGLPLYINQVSGFMKLSNCSLTEFIHSYSPDLLGGDNLGPNWMYERMVSAVFDDAIKELSEDPHATGLLYMMAFLSPDGVPEHMLLKETDREELAFLRFRRKSKYLATIGRLNTSQLIHREIEPEPYLTIHRSVQEGLLQRLNGDMKQRQMAFNRAVAMLGTVCPPPASKLQQAEVNRWPVIEAVLPHILNIQAGFNRAEPKIKGSIEFAQLLADVATMELFDRRFIEDGQKLLQTALVTLDELHEPPDIPLRADIKVILGLFTDELGITERLNGLDLRISIRDIRETCFNRMTVGEVKIEDEIRLFNTYTDLACSYQQLNRFDEVYELCTKCYERYRRWGSEDQHPYEYAKYYHHMAFVFVHWNEPEKALAFAKRGAELMSLAVPDAQIATVYRFDWAVILFQCGQREEAIEEHKVILESRMQECGLKNILTIQSILMLGILHYFTGDLVQAEKYLRQTLTLDRKVHWPSENIARARYYLGLVLREQHHEGSVEADMLLLEAQDFIERILESEISQSLTPGLADDKLLFDYIVGWGYRVSVVRSSSHN